jgi:hypothetical protein
MKKKNIKGDCFENKVGKIQNIKLSDEKRKEIIQKTFGKRLLNETKTKEELFFDSSFEKIPKLVACDEDDIPF